MAENQWDEFDEEISINMKSDNSINILKIGILYDHPFGARFINNLINKQDFCTHCGPLCINCRSLYSWFAGKIYYVHKINFQKNNDINECWKKIEKNLRELDLLLVIGIEREIIMELPNLANEYKIKAVIIPVEDPKWLEGRDQIILQSKFAEFGIEVAFPRPFCSLNPDRKTQNIIYLFTREFHVGYPILEFSTENEKIIKTKVIQSAPCGSTYFIAQYLRNEQYNQWNTESIEKRISNSMRLYPCMASKERDNVIEASIRVVAEKIAQETIKKALKEEKNN